MSSSFTSYVNASRYLRGAIEQNRSDTEFAGRGGEIIYLFDTNIVESFLRANYAIVGSPFRAGELFKPKAAEVSGRLTLKYLFSGELPGQKGPAYLSTPHWNEVLGRADRVAAEARAEFRKLDPAAINSLARAYPVLHSIRGSPTELLVAAESLKVGEAFLALAKNASTNIRLQDTFIGRGPGQRLMPYVMDVERCEEFWTFAKDAVRRSDFRYWQALLNQARRKITAGRKHTRDNILSNNIEHDAITIAAIQAMYRENPTSGGSHPSLRFILVSADRSLELAMMHGEGQLAAEGIPNFLRHPRVYMPLLNFSSMNKELISSNPDHEAVRKVFFAVERTIKALLPFDYSSRTASRVQSDWDLQPNIERWSLAAEQLMLVNSRYVLNDLVDVDAVIEQVANILQKPDVLAAAADTMLVTLRSIRTEHTEQLAGLALDRLVSAHRRIRARQGIVGQRAPLKPLDVDLLQVLRPILSTGVRSDLATLDDLLNRIITDEGRADGLLSQVISQLSAALRSQSGPPDLRTVSQTGNSFAAAARLFASAIYFSLGAWDSARLCAELCSESLHLKERFGPWAREANYFRALALRMTLRSADELSAAAELLSENIRRADRTSLAYSRDLVEHATLFMTATVLQAIENVTPNQNFSSDGEWTHLLDAPRIPLRFDEAIRDLERACQFVEGFEGSQTYAASRVRIQANINLLGGAIFGHLLRTGITEEHYGPDEIGRAVKVLRADLEEFAIFPPPPTAQLYLAIGAYPVSYTHLTLPTNREV